jgi:acetoin utilization protein AcuB
MRVLTEARSLLNRLSGGLAVIAQDLMTKNPVRINEEAKVRDAVELLANLDVRHLPVVNADDEVVGMLSDRDLRALTVPAINAGEYEGRVMRALDAKVATVMSADVLTVDAEADVYEIVDLMLDNKVGAVPVVDSEGNLVGIISYIDVLRAAEFE